MGSAGMSGFEAAGEWAWPYRGIRSQVRQHDAAVAPMFSVADTRQATKALAATPRNSRERVALKMAELAPDSFGASNAKTLVGDPGHRLREGDWRVICDLETGRLVVRVLRIGARGGVCK